jgi:hypothetical protein
MTRWQTLSIWDVPGLHLVMAMAMVIALGMRDLPLRSVASDASVDEPAALAHQSGMAPVRDQAAVRRCPMS